MQDRKIPNLAMIATIIVAALWTATGAALSTRFHLVFLYETLVTVTPQLDLVKLEPSLESPLL